LKTLSDESRKSQSHDIVVCPRSVNCVDCTEAVGTGVVKMSDIPAGWYDDGSGTQRYWDGSTWTEHVVPAAEATPVSVDPIGVESPGVSVTPVVEQTPAPAAEPALAFAPAPTYSPSPTYAPAPAGYVGGYVAPPMIRKRRVWPWVVGASAFVFLLLVGGGIALLISTVSGSTDGPRSAVLAYDKAWREDDCDALHSVITDPETYSCDDFDSDYQSFQAGIDDYKLVIVSTNVLGDSAEVQTKESYTLDGTPQVDHYSYSLVKQDGFWRVDTIDQV